MKNQPHLCFKVYDIHIQKNGVSQKQFRRNENSIGWLRKWHGVVGIGDKDVKF